MERILVTVAGPSRNVETAVPATEPVGSLVHTLLEIVEGHQVPSEQARGWGLVTEHGWPLEPETTLAAFGIVEGAVLRLVPPELVPQAALEPSARPGPEPPPVPTAPLVHREPELPQPLGVGERLKLAVDAALGTNGHPLADESAEPASVERLAVNTDASAIERAKRAWEESAYRHQLEERIAAPRLNRCATIAVISPKGGVGKTTVASMLGTLLSEIRNDRVVAVDADPDYGTLGRVLGTPDAVHVDELLDVLEQPALTVSMLDRFLGRGPHGLMVLPAPTEEDRMEVLDGEAYRRVLKRLEDLVGILIVDCGSGVLSAPVRAALESADQVVIVTDSDPATASLVAQAAMRLPEGTDYVIVVNKAPRGRPGLNLDNLREDVGRARMLVQVEGDAAAAGRLQQGRFDWDSAPHSWQVEIRELAAGLISGWESLGLAG